MTKYAMLVDYKYCTGCHSCEVSCVKEKGLTGSEWGIKINEVGPAKFEDGAWEWDFIPTPSRRCDLCVGRIEEGKKPLCELHCLAACLKIVPVEEVSDTLAGKEEGKVAVFLP